MNERLEIEIIMTQEEKELLLKDLCGRLLYGVKVSITAHNLDCEKDFGKTIIADLIGIHTEKDDDGITHACFITCYDKFITQGNYIETIKPYLRPLSSMTEEESEELKQEHVKDEKLYAECLTRAAKGDNSLRGKVIIHYAADWCNRNHFDYRGLIPMGLALEAPEGMYKTE